MSGIFVQIWLRTQISETQVDDLQNLANRVGRKIESNSYTWATRPKRLPPKSEPIDLLLKENLSSELRTELVKLKNISGNPHDIAHINWCFELADSSSLPGAPSAEDFKYKTDDIYPSFVVGLGEKLFESIPGWNTDKDNIDNTISTQEMILQKIGWLPSAFIWVITPTHIGHPLIGYLSLEVLTVLDALLVVESRCTHIPNDLDELHQLTTKNKFPGTIYRFVSTYQAFSGPQEHVWHVIDAEFLRHWLEHPTFRLI